MSPPLKTAYRFVIVTGLVLYLFLFGFNALTRNGQFTADSMNYVDVAENIASGRGLVQSTLGFNQIYLFDANSRAPVAFTSQAPLYPVLVAGLDRLDVSGQDAALLVPVIAYGAVLLLGFLLARDLYNESTARLALALLILYAPLALVSRTAWSEAASAALVLLTFFLLVRTGRQADIRAACALALGAGLAAGLVFSTRYALLPLALLGGVFLLLQKNASGSKLAPLASYVAGALLPVALVLLHNHGAAGYLLPPILPSDRSWTDNLSDAVAGSFGNWFGEDGWSAQAAIALVLFGFAAVQLALRGRLRVLSDVFINKGRYLLTVWFLGYFVFIIYQRSTQNFDRIGTRIMVPASIVLVLLAAALIAGALGPRAGKRAYGAVLAAVAVLACLIQIGIIINEPVINNSEKPAGSPRLSWVADNTTPDDLIIGDDSLDIPFFNGNHTVASFSNYPFTTRLTYDRLMEFADGSCGAYDNIYIVLRAYHKWPLDRQVYLYGQFITDIRESRLDAYPGIVPVAHLEDGDVYRIACRADI